MSLKSWLGKVEDGAPGGGPVSVPGGSSDDLRDSGSGSGSGSGGETLKIVVHALLIAIVVRVFFYQPFNIPSGSMKDTLLIGDYLFVSKLSYGYSKYSFPYGAVPFTGRVFSTLPKRGDVAVFKLPRDNATDYIKRVIGLPGDEIQMRSGQLFINGTAVPKKRVADFVAAEEDGVKRSTPRYEETLPEGKTYFVLDAEANGPFDNVGPYKVPAGHYFMMGDNRDNSTDSRALYHVGYVPFDNFVGRADLKFFSAAIDEGVGCSLINPLSWPGCIRWRRLFTLVR